METVEIRVDLEVILRFTICLGEGCSSSFTLSSHARRCGREEGKFPAEPFGKLIWVIIRARYDLPNATLGR